MSDKKSTQGAGTPAPSGASEATPDTVEGQAPVPAEADAAGTVPAEADAAAPADAEAPTGTEAPAAGLPDLEAHTEAPAWLSGNGEHDGKVWEGAFEAEPGEPAGAGPAAAEPAAEPEVTNPDDVTLETPALGEADISSDAAEAASLRDATAEVKEVEAQAADAAVLTDPAANHPAAVNRTDGIAAAAPMTGDSPGDSSDARDDKPSAGTETGTQAAGPDTGTQAEGDATPTADTEDGSKPTADDHAGAATGGAAAGAAAATDPAESRRSRRTDPAPSSEPAGNGRNKRLLMIIGIIGVLAVLVVLFFTVILGNSEKEPGVLEEDVAPIELETGACLQDFTGINEPTTVVTCETPHNAQLVATDTYPDADDFPGTEALSSRATEICSEVRYSDALAERGDLDLQENKVIPTPESWRDGDRRIDCFVVAGSDQELTESLLEQ